MFHVRVSIVEECIEEGAKDNTVIGRKNSELTRFSSFETLEQATDFIQQFAEHAEAVAFTLTFPKSSK